MRQEALGLADGGVRARLRDSGPDFLRSRRIAIRGSATALSELVDFSIDRHFSFLRTTKYRHYRRFLGPWMTHEERKQGAPERRARWLRETARPKYVRVLLREWRALKGAVRALLHAETMVFEIGKPFVLGERVWICTDVGARTISAVPLDELDASRDRGPPYSIVERVLDAYAMDGCEPAPC